MERHELNRMFDQLTPTPEQEQKGLDRILQTERKVTSMKKLKKLTVVGIAAALMVISCAAAVVTGFDQRLAKYFGARPEQVGQLAVAAATQDPMSHTYDNGWTVQISQVLSDRYMVAALIDFAAPEGMALPIPEGTTADRELTLMVDYRIEDKNGNLIGSLKDAPLPEPVAFDSEDGGPVYGHWDLEVAGEGLGDCEYLESSDPEQGRISVLWEYVLGNGPWDFIEDELLGAHVSILPKGVSFDSTRETIYFGEEDGLWSYDVTLPETDSGSVCTMGTSLMLGGQEVKLETIYLSPLELAYEFTSHAQMPANTLPLYEEETRGYAINMADGSSVPVKFAFAHHAKRVGDKSLDHIGLYPVEFIDPAQVVSFSMFGQTFDLK